MRDVVLGDDGDRGSGDGGRPVTGPSGDELHDAPAAASLRDAVVGYRRWLLALAGALVVVLATVVVPELRAREQDARLVDVPGVLFPLDPPLEPIWSGPVGLGLEEVTHDVLVAIFRSPGRVALVPLADGAAGARTLAAVGLSDGRVRWTAQAPEGTLGYIEAGGHLFALHGSRITRLS